MTNLLEKSDNRPTASKLVNRKHFVLNAYDVIIIVEFKSFLHEAHNLFVTGDSSVRSSLLRGAK